jgi:hypothetical protein
MQPEQLIVALRQVYEPMRWRVSARRSRLIGRFYLPTSLWRVTHEGRREDLVTIFVEQEYKPFPVAVHAWPRRRPLSAGLARQSGIRSSRLAVPIFQAVIAAAVAQAW